MSNRAVSATYRTVIDDVIANVRQDFEDMGIEKEVLDELQRSWEAKIVATGVADFEGAAPVPARRRQQNAGSSSSSSAAIVSATTTKGKDAGEQKNGKPTVKTEDGVGEGGEANNNKVARTNGTSDVHDDATSHTIDAVAPAELSGGVNGEGTVLGSTMGGAGSSNGAATAGTKRKRPLSDDNEIGSDLDDSDEDEMEGNIDADGNEDMILCLYDKVQRIRNKWKCVLKDGVASIDGRDYVFSKLSSELEW